MRAWMCLAGVGAAACSPLATEAPAADDEAVDAPIFVEQAKLGLDASGASTELHLDVPRDARSIVVRARGAEGAAVTLDAVVTDEGETWVEDARATGDDGLLCRHCSAEIAAGDGYGLFPLPATSGLTLRVGLRDARFGGFTFDPTLTSVPVRVEAAFPAAPPPSAQAHIELRVGRARNVGAAEVLVDVALDEAARIFGDASIALTHGPVIALDVEVPAIAEVARGRTEALAALAEALGDAPTYVPIVIVDRIAWSDPLHGEVADLAALSTRIGGSPAPSAEGAVFVAIGAARAAVLPPGVDRGRWLGAIVAHEIGHWLGLRHDQDRNVPVASPTLMSAFIAVPSPDPRPLTEAQARALARHPLVFFSRREP